MTRTRVAVAALYAALNANRQERELSWRQLAKEIGVSPSLLSRLGNGLRPDADGFVTLCRWLGLPAETFMIDGDAGERPTADQPELTAQLAPLLRARKDLDDEDIEYLEDLLRATLRHVRARRM